MRLLQCDGQNFANVLNNSRDVSNNVIHIPSSMGGQVIQMLGDMDSGSRAVTTTGGGSGSHAPGCRQVPTYTTYTNSGGPNGSRGPPGNQPAYQLFPGRKGMDGSALYVVTADDGAPNPYSEKFNFQLVSFEVEDENQDGIFEPGECIVISNIVVSNTGRFSTARTLIHKISH